MWGVLLVPSSSPTLSPISDGLNVNVTSNVTWFHLNHDMVSRRIYKLSFYGGHSIITCLNWGSGCPEGMVGARLTKTFTLIRTPSCYVFYLPVMFDKNVIKKMEVCIPVISSDRQDKADRRTDGQVGLARDNASKLGKNTISARKRKPCARSASSRSVMYAGQNCMCYLFYPIRGFECWFKKKPSLRSGVPFTPDHVCFQHKKIVPGA